MINRKSKIYRKNSDFLNWLWNTIIDVIRLYEAWLTHQEVNLLQLVLVLLTVKHAFDWDLFCICNVHPLGHVFPELIIDNFNFLIAKNWPCT